MHITQVQYARSTGDMHITQVQYARSTGDMHITQVQYARSTGDMHITQATLLDEQPGHLSKPPASTTATLLGGGEEPLFVSGGQFAVCM